MNRTPRRCITVVVASALAASLCGEMALEPALAGSRKWDGSESDEWFTAGNWTPAGAPASSDDLYILDQGTGGRVLRVDPATGNVSEVFTGFGGPTWAGVDTSPDGRQVIVTDSGSDAIYVFARCLGDLDRDNDVDLADLAQLLANYGTTTGATYEDGDLDGDGDVDLTDLAELLGYYGETCP